MFFQKSVMTMVATVAISAFAAPGYAQNTVSSTEAGFSYPLPAGWSSRKMPQSEYPVAYTTPQNGFAPNINVVREVFAGTMDAYFEAAKKSFAQVPTMRIVSEARFTTKSGVRGWKLVYTNAIQGKSLRQIAYLFPAKGGGILIFTLSTLAEEGKKYDAVNKAMLQLTLDK